MSKRKSSRRWIQHALKKGKHAGQLRMTVEREFGSAGFDENGDIKMPVLRSIARNPAHELKTRRRANLAITLRRLRK